MSVKGYLIFFFFIFFFYYFKKYFFKKPCTTIPIKFLRNLNFNETKKKNNKIINLK